MIANLNGDRSISSIESYGTNLNTIRFDRGLSLESCMNGLWTDGFELWLGPVQTQTELHTVVEETSEQVRTKRRVECNL